MQYEIKWTAKDIKTLRPEWTLKKCEEWLQENWKHVRDRSIELGWEVIETLLPEEEEPESSPKEQTYWLYYNGKLLTSVIHLAGTEREAVIRRAVKQHRRVPLHHDGMAPFEFEACLLRAEVRTDDQG